MSFFSGRDIAELHETAGNYPFYLSIVVNNRDDMVAKIAVVSSRKTVMNEEYSFNNVGGKSTKFKSDEVVEDEVLLIWDCEVIKPVFSLESYYIDKFGGDANFIKQAAYITEQKVAAEKAKNAKVKTTYPSGTTRFADHLAAYKNKKNPGYNPTPSLWDDMYEETHSQVTNKPFIPDYGKAEIFMSRIVSNNASTMLGLNLSLRALQSELESMCGTLSPGATAEQKEEYEDTIIAAMDMIFNNLGENIEIIYDSVYDDDKLRIKYMSRIKEAQEELLGFESQYETIVDNLILETNDLLLMS